MPDRGEKFIQKFIWKMSLGRDFGVDSGQYSNAL
jgi:hypothetical protein